MPRRKIVIGMMMHETNTFSPVPTPLESFRPLDEITNRFSAFYLLTP